MSIVTFWIWSHFEFTVVAVNFPHRRPAQVVGEYGCRVAGGGDTDATAVFRRVFKYCESIQFRPASCKLATSILYYFPCVGHHVEARKEELGCLCCVIIRLVIGSIADRLLVPVCFSFAFVKYEVRPVCVSFFRLISLAMLNLGFHIICSKAGVLSGCTLKPTSDN